MIIFFVITIARAWQMLGARGTRVLAMLAELLRERSTTAVATGAGEDPEGVMAATGDPEGRRLLASAPARTFLGAQQTVRFGYLLKGPPPQS